MDRESQQRHLCGKVVSGFGHKPPGEGRAVYPEQSWQSREGNAGAPKGSCQAFFLHGSGAKEKQPTLHARVRVGRAAPFQPPGCRLGLGTSLQGEQAMGPGDAPPLWAITKSSRRPWADIDSGTRRSCGFFAFMHVSPCASASAGDSFQVAMDSKKTC